MSSRIELNLSVVVLADDAKAAHEVVSRLLKSSHPAEKHEDPIENIVFRGVRDETVSPWRPAADASKNGKSFFAIDRAMGKDAAEFAASVRWHADKQAFVDASNLQPFTFTHWMPIPPE
ncbi:hypothetical protein BST65_22900 [Bradyrhizobium canariense]|nr:hypothetical protein [Bradyrhizobium canariense]OSI22851.1 hypothetical protein BST65_22900 [Bradyrhizobium canariense]OSI30205.1 hypothetical protein BST66_24825 [Bradyrhizobium canariense]OSI38517.1 hypothetical protein BSZ20_36875 [Bradyrhizobium canariense]OSI46864.1 hypothetical protein BST67_24120 [Bradyrhizobium canariense]OSI50900.1 hypothetical protein BSZ15_32610 [Bradyrhizobium canariense]